MLQNIFHVFNKIQQGMIYNILTKKRHADPSYTNHQNLEFNVILPANHYANFNSMHFCFPIKIKKWIVANNIRDDLITANKFFAHWVKEIVIKRHGDDLQMTPTTNSVEIYRYSDAQLKHLPKDSLKAIEKTLLYSKKSSIFSRRRPKT